MYLKGFSNKIDVSKPDLNYFSRFLIMFLKEDHTNLRFKAITLPPFTVLRKKLRTYSFFGGKNFLLSSFKQFPRQDQARIDSVNKFSNETPFNFCTQLPCFDTT